MRQHLAFGRDGRGGDLRHHEARVHTGVAGEERREPLIEIGVYQPIDASFGYRGQIRHHNGEQVADHGHRLPVKIAAAQHLAVLEDERIVGGGVEFTGHDPLGELEGIEHRSVYLRHAPQRIRILHTRIVGAVRLTYFAVEKDRA